MENYKFYHFNHINTIKLHIFNRLKNNNIILKNLIFLIENHIQHI